MSAATTASAASSSSASASAPAPPTRRPRKRKLAPEPDTTTVASTNPEAIANVHQLWSLILPYLGIVDLARMTRTSWGMWKRRLVVFRMFVNMRHNDFDAFNRFYRATLELHECVIMSREAAHPLAVSPLAANIKAVLAVSGTKQANGKHPLFLLCSETEIPVFNDPQECMRAWAKAMFRQGNQINRDLDEMTHIKGWIYSNPAMGGLQVHVKPPIYDTRSQSELYRFYYRRRPTRRSERLSRRAFSSK